ncbi:MAG: alpha-hydroxy acid oxidase [Kofleriaceae bacterium]|nr:alpha-hydroxy acid oxidase [Kofleriaceae bacterium]
MARRRLPNFAWEYIEGGAEDESTLTRNCSAFADHLWVHRVGVNVEKRTLETNLLGGSFKLPFAIGPTGFNGMLWKHGDIELAKAAKDAGIPFITSTVASDSVRDIAKHVDGRLWFQLFILKDPKGNDALIHRAEEAGCDTMFVTLDAPTIGNRTWNNRNYSKPMQLSLRSKLNVLAHPRWFMNVYFPGGLPGFGNLAEFLPPDKRSPLDGARVFGSQDYPELTWADVERVRERWRGKLVLKGLLAREDVARAVKLGADGVVLSNHGGRQLDYEISALDVLPAIAAEFRDKLTIMIDGGFRRGSDIAKALALGADMVLLGRATLYGLAAGGQAGAARALEILRSELDLVLMLLGCPHIADLSPQFLHTKDSSAGTGRAHRSDELVLGRARAATG